MKSEWQIYECYSSYLQNPIENLHKLSKTLINHEFASIILSSDGKMYRKQNNMVYVNDINFEQENYSSGAKLKPPHDLTESEFISLLDFSSLKVNELKLFADLFVDFKDYIRCYIDKIVLSNDRLSIHIYPVLKIYSTGVIQLNLRFFSAENYEYSEEEFIHDYLNLFLISFTNLKLPIHLSKWAFIETGLFRKEEIRDHISKEKISVDLEEKKYTSLDVSDLYKLSNFKLNFIKDYIFGYFEFILNQKKNARYENNLGSYWHGKPYVFIISDDLLLAEKKDLIKKIMVRSPIDSNYSELYPPEDLRLYNDFSHYSSQAICLGVVSEKEEHYTDIINTISLIEEEIEHIFMLFKQEFERIDISKDMSSILAEKNYLQKLKEILLFHAANNGEIEYVLQQILQNHYKLNQLEEALDNKIAQRLQLISHYRNLKIEKLITFFSLLFGLVSGSAIYTYLIRPILGLTGEITIKDAWAYGITLTVFLTVTIFINYIVHKE